MRWHSVTSATLVGVLVLGQIPSGRDLVGVALVVAGVRLHRERV
jgi:inner membrane transporter RhtA